MKRLFLGAIRIYQSTRMLRKPSCRFYPSCSSYMYGAVERFGLVRGIALGSWRVLKCHPFHPGGVDEVPDSLPAIKEMVCLHSNHQHTRRPIQLPWT